MRLKEILPDGAEAWKYTFQFQIGAIKRPFAEFEGEPRNAFQFQIGAIKSTHNFHNLLIPSSEFQFQIGAIKSQQMQNLNIHYLLMFQFQIGAIKRLVLKTIPHFQIEFQFQIGAIKSHTHSKPTLLSVYVSIPNWCD